MPYESLTEQGSEQHNAEACLNQMARCWRAPVKRVQFDRANPAISEL